MALVDWELKLFSMSGSQITLSVKVARKRKPRWSRRHLLGPSSPGALLTSLNRTPYTMQSYFPFWSTAPWSMRVKRHSI